MSPPEQKSDSHFLLHSLLCKHGKHSIIFRESGGKIKETKSEGITNHRDGRICSLNTDVKGMDGNRIKAEENEEKIEEKKG